jgi:ATP-dependent protease ClpP protease subunit
VARSAPEPVELTLFGTVDEDTAGEVIAGLNKALLQKRKAVFLTIDSGGGSVWAGLELIEAMRRAERGGIEITCLADGLAGSMAFVILQACPGARFMTKRTALMAHEVSVSGAGGKAADIRRTAQRMDSLDTWLTIIETARLKISLEEFRKQIAGREWFFGAAEALAVGAVDGVV